MKNKLGIYADYDKKIYKLESYDNTLGGLAQQEIFGKIFLKVSSIEFNETFKDSYPRGTTKWIPLSGITSLYEVKFNI